MKLPLVVMLIGLAVSTSAQDGQIYCGRRLSSMLAYLCNNGLIMKRSDEMQYYGKEYSWPWITPHKALGLVRGKRQAATECCDKPCTISELMGYCRD